MTTVDVWLTHGVRSADSERAAFRDIYLEHGRAVHDLVCRVAWPGVADDVTQEVFLRLWRHPEKYDAARGSLRAYLSTVAHSLAIDTIRSDTARRVREGRHLAEPSPEAVDDEPDQRVVRAGQRSDIAQALATLGPDERTAVVTAFYGECTYRQVALTLGVAEGTVKSRIRRGLQRLKVVLDEPPAVAGGLSSAGPSSVTER